MSGVRVPQAAFYGGILLVRIKKRRIKLGRMPCAQNLWLVRNHYPMSYMWATPGPSNKQWLFKKTTLDLTVVCMGQIWRRIITGEGRIAFLLFASLLV